MHGDLCNLYGKKKIPIILYSELSTIYLPIHFSNQTLFVDEFSSQMQSVANTNTNHPIFEMTCYFPTYSFFQSNAARLWILLGNAVRCEYKYRSSDIQNYPLSSYSFFQWNVIRRRRWRLSFRRAADVTVYGISLVHAEARRKVVSQSKPRDTAAVGFRDVGGGWRDREPGCRYRRRVSWFLVSRAAHLAIMIIGIGHDRASNTETPVTPLGKVTGDRPVSYLPENTAAVTKFFSIRKILFYLLTQCVFDADFFERNLQILFDTIIGLVCLCELLFRRFDILVWRLLRLWRSLWRQFICFCVIFYFIDLIRWYSDIFSK